MDALSSEAIRRGKKLGRPYSYGQLVADTTEEEREKIAEDYKAAFRRKGGGGTRSEFTKTDQDAMVKIRQKNESHGGAGE